MIGYILLILIGCLIGILLSSSMFAMTIRRREDIAYQKGRKDEQEAAYEKILKHYEKEINL